MNTVLPRAARRAKARQLWRDLHRLAPTWREHWEKFNLLPLRFFDS